MRPLKQSYQSLQLLHNELEANYRKQAEQLAECNAAKNEQHLASQHWEKQYYQNQKAFDAKTNQVIELQAENKVLLQQLKDSEFALNEQLNQVKHLGQEKWLLAQKKAQLEGPLREGRELIEIQA